MKFVVFLFVVYFPCSSAAQVLPKQLNFGYVENDQLSLTVTKILTIAYQELAIELQFVALPSKRSLLQSDSGQIDGEVLRIDNIDNLYSNLIAIPVPLFNFVGMAYTINCPTRITDATDILNARVAIHSGMVWQEKFIAQGPGSYTRVNNEESLFKLLIAKRVDYVLLGRSSATELLNTTYAKHNIVAVSPQITQSSLFHYVHRKHQDLVPLITRALKKMRVSGELAKIWRHRAKKKPLI